MCYFEGHVEYRCLTLDLLVFPSYQFYPAPPPLRLLRPITMIIYELSGAKHYNHENGQAETGLEVVEKQIHRFR